MLTPPAISPQQESCPKAVRRAHKHQGVITMKSNGWVRLLAGLSLALAGAAQAGSYSSLYVFGDSLSDSGNNALAIGADPAQVVSGNQYIASQPFASGTYSNGAVWSQQFATRLGLSATPSLAGGSNYAFGGAKIDGAWQPGEPPSMTSQLGMFLADAGGQADANGLYVVAGGGPNISAALMQVMAGADPVATTQALATQYAITMGTIVDGLQAAGAQHIVVWNAPNFGLTPLAQSYGAAGTGLATAISAAMNAALQARLSFEGVGVQSFDVYGLLNDVVANPSSYGFENVGAACGAAVLGCNPASALFYDGIHPTTLAHQVLSNSMYALAVPEPATTALWMLGLAGVAAGVNRRKKIPTP